MSVKPFVLIGIDEDALAAGVVDDVLIRDPVRDRDDDFVAGIDQHLHQVEDDVLAAHGDDAFGGRVAGAEILRVALADRLLQLLRAAGRRVLGEVLVDRADGGLLDVVGRGKVGFAGAEIDNVDAFAPQAVRRRRRPSSWTTR